MQRTGVAAGGRAIFAINDFYLDASLGQRKRGH
jgi:hypothetical protein